MHTQEEVQVTFQPTEIKKQGGILLRGIVEVVVPCSQQDERFVERMERSVDRAGQELKRDWMRLMLEQADTELVLERLSADRHRSQQRRGKRRMTFKTTFGTVTAHRYRLLDKTTGKMSIPSAEAWKTPRQVTITRPLRDLVCDTAREESYRKTVQRVSCHAGEANLLSASSVMNILHEEGAALAKAMRQRVDDSFRRFSPAEEIFAPASGRIDGECDSWAATLELEENAAAEKVRQPPVGFGGQEPLGESDGPRRVDEGSVLVQVDEVKVKAQPQTGRAAILVYTAVVMAAAVRWHLVAESVADLARQVGAVLAELEVHRGRRRLLVLADGAHWISAWFEGLPLAGKTMIVCWYHLAKRCGEFLSRAGRGKQHRNDLRHELLSLLWEGKVQEAIAYLDSRRSEMKSAEAIDGLQAYLRRREPYLPNYRARQEASLWIASNRVEKLNDATVSDRCKGRGMAWTPPGVLSLAKLESSECNGELACWRSRRALASWGASAAQAA